MLVKVRYFRTTCSASFPGMQQHAACTPRADLIPSIIVDGGACAGGTTHKSPAIAWQSDEAFNAALRCKGQGVFVTPQWVQVAIKWINVHVDSRAQESGGGGLSSAQRWALLSAEVSTMKRLRDSLQGPVPVTAGYPAAPPAGVRLEEANVVIYLTVHASDLNLAAIRSLEDPEPTQLMQARRCLSSVPTGAPLGLNRGSLHLHMSV